MNKLRLFLLTACALPILSKAVESDPAGFVTVNLAGNSDSYVYIPFKRSPAFVGMAASLASNGMYDPGEAFTDNVTVNGTWDAGEPFTDTNNVVSLAGTPAFTVNQFVYVAGTQSNRYYAFLKSGTRAGMYYTVVSNSSTSITLDLAGDDLATAGAITGTTSLEVIPYDTLGTVFPAGAGVHSSSSHSASTSIRRTSVFVPDQSTAGKNLAFPVSYYYYSGSVPPGLGWRRAGFSDVLANDDVLPPDTFFAVRHNIATQTTLTFTGTVQMSQLSTPINTIQSATDQDNAVALPFATEMTLAQLKLFESGAFTGSGFHSAGQRKDVVLVWDNTVPGKNKAADVSYYYYTGADTPGPGWRRTGVSDALADNDIVVGPNKCVVVRKKATAQPISSLWSVRPPYVPTN